MKKLEIGVGGGVNTEQVVKCCRGRNDTLMIRFKAIMAMSPKRRSEVEGEEYIKWLDSPAGIAIRKNVEK
jgi:hypothetical protein